MGNSRNQTAENQGTKRRILLGSMAFGEPFGGAALSALLVSQLLEPEYEVAVLTANDGSGRAAVHELRLGPVRADIPMLLHLPMKAIGITRQVEQIIRSFRPDLIHLQDANLVDPVVPVGKKLGVPVVVTLRDLRFASRQRWKTHAPKDKPLPALWGRAKSFLELIQLNRPITWALPLLLPLLSAKPAQLRAMLQQATLLLPISRFLQEELRHCGVTAPSLVLRLLPVPEWPVLPLRDPPSRRFLFVGRLVRGKGVRVLIESFCRVLERLPDAELVIAGDGPEQRALEKLAERLGCKSRIRFLGFVAYHQGYRLYEEADIVVFPSALPEGLGRVLVEASAVGRPVIASRVGGVPEIIGPESGILCPPGDVEELANQMLSLAQDPERQQRLVQAGRERAVEFSFGHLRAALTEIYEKVLRGETQAT